MSSVSSNSQKSQTSFFYGDTIKTEKERKITKIDQATFKQIYSKCFEGKYSVALFILLKRHMVKH
ncbi:MAG: hypothetical protein ACK521_06180 [bacterium]